MKRRVDHGTGVVVHLAARYVIPWMIVLTALITLGSVVTYGLSDQDDQSLAAFSDPGERPGLVQVGEIEDTHLKMGYLAESSLIQTIRYPDAAYIKVHLLQMDLQPGDFVTVSDPAGTQVHTYPGVSGYTTDGGGGFWALSVIGDTAIVKLHSGEAEALSLAASEAYEKALAGESAEKLGVVVDKYARGYSPAEVSALTENIESTCGINQRFDAVCYSASHPVEFGKADAVARLLINNTSLCTAWRVGPDNHVFTNEHCVTSQADVTGTEVWFNYQRVTCGGSVATPTIVTGNSLLIDDYTLDFALFTVNNFSSIAGFGYLDLDVRTPIQDEEIYIPQHGAGNPKEFGIESDANAGNVCRIDVPTTNGRGFDTDTGYRCDTTGGSSGSPVLARSSHGVIGLHHFGIPTGSTCPPEVNKGVRIQNIWPLVEPFLGGGGGPIAYASHSIDDDNLGNSVGNGDGVVNPGETIELFVDLHNAGSDGATAVQAVISTASPYVTFIFNTASDYGDIPGGGTATNLNDFDFEVSNSAPNGHVITFDLNITASNGGPWSDSFDVTVAGGGVGNVALISDQTELQTITPILDDMGLAYDVVDNNWDGTQGLYTSDYGFLSSYNVVVWYASGTGFGRLITQQEHDALEQFLQAGGRLLATGYDTLGSPTDALMADLVRSSSSGDGPFTTNYTITDGGHPITNGPFGSFPAGTALTALSSDHDQAEADTSRGAATVAELSGGRDKIMATELPSGGIVVYWNGNINVSDWTGVLSALQLEGQELKRDADGQPIGRPGRAPQQTVLPEGAFIVEGQLSDTPPAPAGDSGEDGPRLSTDARPEDVVVINFDDAAQPSAFNATIALRNEYQPMGVLFDGPGPNDGGAILDEGGGFGVSGHSPPNFLAFNANASLSDGGTPTDPEEIVFLRPVSYVEIKAGSNSGAGNPLTMEAFDAGGFFLGSDTITLGSGLGTLSVAASGISRIVISSPASVFVLDDLVFDTENRNADLLRNTLHWLVQVVPPPLDPHEPNDDPAACTPIFFDLPITDPIIDPPGDSDYYCFDGAAAQTIAADIDAQVNGSSLDSVLTLFDSDGTTILIQNDDYLGLDSYLEYTLPHEGTYYLRVRSFGHPCCGSPDHTYSILLTDITQTRPLPFFDDMEGGPNGWGADGLWHQVQDGVSPYPNSFSPTHSWWYGQDATGNYDTGGPNSGNLTSPPIEIPAGVQARLSFWQWYETEPMFAPQSVYFDVRHDSDGDDNISGGIYTEWAADLSGAGYTVVEYNQPIDLATLSGHQVLALFDPEIALSGTEIAAINDFMLNGGRVVVLGEFNDLQGVNTVLNGLTTPHGISLNSDSVQDPTNNDGGNAVWPVIYNFADHPLVGGTGAVVEYAGASLALGGPAVPLASGDADSGATLLRSAPESLDEHGLGGGEWALSEDIVPGAPVVMAYAPVGDGGLVAIGDSGLWSNADPDGDGVIALEEYDNLGLSRRLFGAYVDSPTWDQKWVQISTDNGPFVDLLQVTGGPMSAWHPMSVDLSPFAGTVVRLRFRFDTFDGALNAFRGWYVDDVLVEAADVGPVGYNDHAIDDDNSGNSSGDSDGVADAGETIELYVELRNDGASAANNVQACLSEFSPYVPGFIDNTCANYGDIGSGAVVVNAADFDFSIDPSAPGGHVIHFELDVSADNGGPWSSAFDVVVGQGSVVGPLIYVSHIIDDDNVGQSLGNGDGVINPGESIELFVEVLNTGNATAAGVVGTISENSPHVNGFPFNTDSPYGDLPGGGSALNSNDFDFTVEPGAPDGHLIPLCLNLSATNGGPWNNVCFNLPVVAAPTTDAALRVVPSDQDVSLSGGSFDVDIVVENVTHLGAFQFDLVYDPAIVTASGATLGAFLGSSGCSVADVGPIIDNGNGRLTYGAAIVGTCLGPSGDGVVATVTLQPAAVGDSDLVLQNEQLLNSDSPPGQITPVLLFPGHVTVTDCFFADVDCDGDVDIGDIYNVAYRWGTSCGSAAYGSLYDLDNDCDIDGGDIQIAACYFGWPSGDFSICFVPTLSMDTSDQPPEGMVQDTVVWIEPNLSVVANGDTFRVDVMVDDAQNLGGFQLVLDYDPAVLEVPTAVNPMVLGSFLGSTGRTVVEFINEIDPVTGVITYVVNSLGGSPGPDGDGSLAYVDLRARALGSSDLVLRDAKVWNVGGQEPSVSVGDGRVVVAAAPNPAQVSVQKSGQPATAAPDDLLTYTLQRDLTLAGSNIKYDEWLIDPIPNHTTYVADSATLNGLAAPQLYSTTWDAIVFEGSDFFTDTDQLQITFQVQVGDVPSGTLIVNTMTETVSFDGLAFTGPYVDTVSTRITRDYRLYVPLMLKDF